MTPYVVIGVVGAVILLGGLLVIDVLDGLFSFDAGGAITGPVLGAFFAAFGLAGALVVRPAGHLVAVGTGLASGVALGGAALFLTRSLMNMPTDAAVRTADVVGTLGRVLTRIPADGYGEVTVASGGHQRKLAARSHEPVPAGTTVLIVDRLSETAVQVQRADF